MLSAQKFLKKVPQYTRQKRHIDTLLRHGNVRKWANVVRVEWERNRRRIRVKGHPYILIIDPCNVCNLRCPLCPTGLNDLGREQSMMSLEHFKRYFDPFAPYLFEVYMHNWGESLLNKQVYEMIAHAQSRDVGTNLSSNFVKIAPDDIENILDSGLEYLIISLDGTNQETYVQYRVGGDYDCVIENLSALIRRRNARKLKRPFIEWQFIVMRQNEHQVPEAERLAKKLGVDLLRFIPVGMPYEFTNRKETAEKWYPRAYEGRVASSGTEQQFGQAAKPGPCFYLYRSFVINPDGGVSPCCVVYRQNRDFADLTEHDSIDVLDIYNNEFYRSARGLFNARQDLPHVPSVCDACDIFTRPDHKWALPSMQKTLPGSSVLIPVEQLVVSRQGDVGPNGQSRVPDSGGASCGDKGKAPSSNFPRSNDAASTR